MGECLIIKSGSGIDTSNATVTSKQLVTGYTCYVNDELVAGEIPIISPPTQLHANDSIHLQYGYYEDNSTINVVSIKNETPATSTPDDLFKDASGWVNGQLVIGTIADCSKTKINLSVNGSYTIPKGWYDTSLITQELLTQPGVSITPSITDTVACNSNRWTIGDVIIIGDTNLTPEIIKNGVTIYGTKGNFIGWVDETMPASVIMSSSGGSLTISSAWGTHGGTVGTWGTLTYEQAELLSKRFTTISWSVWFYMTAKYSWNTGAWAQWIKRWVNSNGSITTSGAVEFESYAGTTAWSHTTQFSDSIGAPGTDSHFAGFSINLYCGTQGTITAASSIAAPVFR